LLHIFVHYGIAGPTLFEWTEKIAEKSLKEKTCWKLAAEKSLQKKKLKNPFKKSCGKKLQ
jgi:hypothetical protein